MHRYLRIVKHLLLGKFRKYVFSVLPVMPLAWVFFAVMSISFKELLFFKKIYSKTPTKIYAICGFFLFH